MLGAVHAMESRGAALGCIRMSSGIERLSRKIRRHTRVVGTFLDGESALVLVTARLKVRCRERVRLWEVSGRDAAG